MCLILEYFHIFLGACCHLNTAYIALVILCEYSFYSLCLILSLEALDSQIRADEQRNITSLILNAVTPPITDPPTLALGEQLQINVTANSSN